MATMIATNDNEEDEEWAGASILVPLFTEKYSTFDDDHKKTIENDMQQTFTILGRTSIRDLSGAVY